jgi:hypothetical protein
MNGGKFDGGALTSDEKLIDTFYQDLFKRVSTSVAISKGAFFDLQYAQLDSYPSKKVYAFLRYEGNDRVLIVCNFDAHKTQTFDIQIPQLAKDMMGIKDVKLQLQHAYIPPHSSEKAHVKGNTISIPANGALLIKL